MNPVLEMPARRFPENFHAQTVERHTKAFELALSRWWRAHFSVRPFHKLDRKVQSQILQDAWMIEHEFKICDFCDEWSDCNRFGVVYLLGNPHEEVFCLEHFRARQKQ